MKMRVGPLPWSLLSRTATMPGRLRATSTQAPPLPLLKVDLCQTARDRSMSTLVPPSPFRTGLRHFARSAAWTRQKRGTPHEDARTPVYIARPLRVSPSRGSTSDAPSRRPRTILAEWGLAALISDAETLVSELMTNALEAAWRLDGRPPMALRLLANHDRLLIEAWDQDTGPCDLHPQEPRGDEDHGRGLMVVDALSQRWGVRRASLSHKVVWAELVVPYLPIGPVGLPRRMPPHELAEHAPKLPWSGGA